MFQMNLYIICVPLSMEERFTIYALGAVPENVNLNFSNHDKGSIRTIALTS